ncbi:hypothetical protein SISSUDRAFT_1054729 [Sistotremastrum suecicum HHB10207 ss-3]|uniref:Uncharacterized protein n=1 Tax=Sistotremastrum suecicum HHB10207 ss-3 TaxID=1314776 RepID=A0A165Y9C4_9AGAM|nr:hypothetical protein SISSUDRAFT_1054729 [Sistotremastrum suecicum HHB10207 ss-3]
MHQGTHFVPTQAFDCDAYMVPRHAEIHHLREDPPVPSGYYARAPMTIPSPETEETRSASAWGENLPTFDQPQDFVASDPYLTHNTQTLLDSPETPRTSTWFQQGPSRNITQMPSGKITAAAPKSASRFPPRPSSEEVIIPGSTDYLSLQSQMGQRVKRSGIETASRRRLQAMEAAHEKVAQSIQRSPAFRDVVPPIKSNGKANALRYNLYLIRLLW